MSVGRSRVIGDALLSYKPLTLQWRHNGPDSVSNHRPHHCSRNRLFRRRSKKTSKLRVTGLCAGNSPETGEFPAQMASNAEKVSIGWRHHVFFVYLAHDESHDKGVNIHGHRISLPKGQSILLKFYYDSISTAKNETHTIIFTRVTVKRWQLKRLKSSINVRVRCKAIYGIVVLS